MVAKIQPSPRRKASASAAKTAASGETQTPARKPFTSNDPSGTRPAWDPELAASVIGKLVLVGVTEVGPDGALIRQTQCFGRIATAEPDHAITLGLEGQRAGESYRLPPDLNVLKPAAAGEYRLRSTGETVTNPDFVCSWTVHKRAGS